jgi:phenylacetate-coenzyme A ligase PaaK-like adenylate-forming protein
VTDFRAEAVNDGGLDALRLQIEVRRGADSAAARRGVGERIKTTFGLTPEVEVLEMGTLAREFEKAVKVPRFVDRRG